MIIEQFVLEYLEEELKVPVYTMLPTNPNPSASPLTFLVVEKTGSGYSNKLHSAVMAVQSYAPTLYEAATLNEAVKEAMLEIITEDEIARVTLNSDYNFTDESTKQPIYQAVFNLTYYSDY